jgi:hypothetical protein
MPALAASLGEQCSGHQCAASRRRRSAHAATGSAKIASGPDTFAADAVRNRRARPGVAERLRHPERQRAGDKNFNAIGCALCADVTLSVNFSGSPHGMSNTREAKRRREGLAALACAARFAYETGGEVTTTPGVFDASVATSDVAVDAADVVEHDVELPVLARIDQAVAVAVDLGRRNGARAVCPPSAAPSPSAARAIGITMP